MGLQESKITTYTDNIKNLPNVPSKAGVTAEELKAMLDGRTDKELKNAINNLIDVLMSQDGAGQIGAVPVIEGGYATVQGILSELQANKLDVHSQLGNIVIDVTNKVDKVPGMTLTSNDYTDEEKEKLYNIEATAQRNVQSDWNATSGDAYIKNKPVSLQGPAGPMGPIGPKGDKGDQGPMGPTGPQGLRGVAGPTGPAGPTGEQGPMGLRGATGPAGPQGVAGEQGPKGDTGPVGATGATGAQGPAGIQGPKGDTGSVGPAGPKGDKGDTGAQGIQGIQGIQGPKGDKGDPGEPGAPGAPGTTIAAEMTIADAGGYFTSGNAEGALQEVGANLSGLEAALAAIIG